MKFSKLSIFLATFFLFCTAIIVVGIELVGYNLPVQNKAETQIVTVKNGETTSELAEQLYQKRIIRNKAFFIRKLKYQIFDNGFDTLQAGTFLVNPSWSSETNARSLVISGGDAQKLQYFQQTAKIAKDVGRKYHVFPSLLLAHSALESDYGRSKLSRKYHNYFGLKTTDEKLGVKLDTQEVQQNNQSVTVQSYFLILKSKEECFKAYAKTLNNGNDWDHNQFKSVINAKTPEDAAKALYTSHYSTDPKIGNKIISIINKYHLKKYDN